ncbi:unnamed protein product [Didymodactylos carnosus]|uniref:Receptor ligand binding region domain-containing protein n=1 Tax=Didymodactylos carnosus TaxID=1234261 RepID=A0A815BRZ1_9BILA|nr:unnamed protein product [Didymodactylos carnosus]CAF1304116.1 unnamed protein product [Didymodactylos carnosus]CAF4066514.1 unnamed protein product [Didymodactylos carnosus]CAF4110854.1 unnamed protein product [Didymodactylos carnosus]
MIPMATISSTRSENEFSNMKSFSNSIESNITNSCGTFEITSVSVHVKSISAVIGSLCSIFYWRPMLVYYFNDYKNEHQGSPASFLFILKMFTSMKYPMLAFNYFHPFHPMNYPNLKFFQLAPMYREEARALLALMDRYDWNTFSLIIDPNLPGEEELISEFEQYSNNQRSCGKISCNRLPGKGQKK